MKRGEREFVDYLRDILYAAEMAESFVEGMDYAAFVADVKTSFAVIRALEIIGEASKKVPVAVCSRYPEIPWREMAGMRDKISHDYFGVDLWRVFETVRQDLPPLCSSIQKILQDLS